MPGRRLVVRVGCGGLPVRMGPGSVGGGADHLISPAANCEGLTDEGLLGYALP